MASLEFPRCITESSMCPVHDEKHSPSDFALRVVAIDDDEQHLKFIATLLSQDNVVVFTSTDSQAGLSLIQAHNPHLVIVDLVMPGLTGMQLLERIVDFDPAIDVVLLTGHYSAE